MCDLCHEIDAKIARYRRLANGVNDRPMLEHLNAFILDLEADKATLHSGLDRSGGRQI